MSVISHIKRLETKPAPHETLKDQPYSTTLLLFIVKHLITCFYYVKHTSLHLQSTLNNSFSLFLFFPFIVVLGGGTLWHLQRFL
jgi:hypothetical protein